MLFFSPKTVSHPESVPKDGGLGKMRGILGKLPRILLAPLVLGLVLLFNPRGGLAVDKAGSVELMLTCEHGALSAVEAGLAKRAFHVVKVGILPELGMTVLRVRAPSALGANEALRFAEGLDAVFPADFANGFEPASF